MDNSQVPNPAIQPPVLQHQVPPNLPNPPPPPPPPHGAPIQPPAGQVPIVQAQVVPGANGNMDLKIHETKLPEFWGQKEKDSISANEFVKRVDKMMSANNWTDKVAFDNFGLALKGEANTWLDSQVLLKKIVGDRERWSIIRPFFKEEFATESDDKLILDGLAHMAMGPTENVRSFFG
jgi:hypothetical protein